MNATTRNQLIAAAAILTAAIVLFCFLFCCAYIARGQDARIGAFSGFDRAAAFRQYNAPDNFTHPYRQIFLYGTNRYLDLGPLFTRLRTNGPPPLTPWVFIRGEIAQVHPHGLLLTLFNYNPDADRVYGGDSACLTNYPGHRQLADGATVKCFAVEIGTFQFRDHRGIQRTVPLYDHGIPFDPQALARSNQLSRAAQTNSIGALK
jgi:hypothetical protein